MREHVHPSVSKVVNTYLPAVDSAVPTLVVGLYLVGSVATDDYRPGRSDIDMLAVVGRTLTKGDVAALGIVHKDLDDPPLDGYYLTVAELHRGPGTVQANAHEGRVTADDEITAPPVPWFELATAVTVRGTPASDLVAWHDVDVLKAFVRTNIEEYWAPWARNAAGVNRIAAWALTPKGVEWGVLGVTRMLYTLETGEVTSKAGTGRWALERLEPRWHPTLEAALAAREGRFLNPLGALLRRERAIAYMHHVIELASKAP